MGNIVNKSDEETKKFLAENSDDVVVWKICEVKKTNSGYNVMPRFIQKDVFGNPIFIKPGCFEPDFKYNDDGIRVYLKREYADFYTCFPWLCVFKFTAKIADLKAVGDPIFYKDETIFSKLSISEKDFTESLRQFEEWPFIESVEQLFIFETKQLFPGAMNGGFIVVSKVDRFDVH